MSSSLFRSVIYHSPSLHFTRQEVNIPPKNCKGDPTNSIITSLFTTRSKCSKLLCAIAFYVVINQTKVVAQTFRPSLAFLPKSLRVLKSDQHVWLVTPTASQSKAPGQSNIDHSEAKLSLIQLDPCFASQLGALKTLDVRFSNLLTFLICNHIGLSQIFTLHSGTQRELLRVFTGKKIKHATFGMVWILYTVNMEICDTVDS